MKKRVNRQMYEVVGGPLDGRKEKANHSYESKDKCWLHAPYWNIVAGTKVLLCIDGTDDEETQHSYRLARCSKTDVKYWTYLGQNVSDQYIQALGNSSFGITPMLKLNP